MAKKWKKKSSKEKKEGEASSAQLQPRDMEQAPTIYLLFEHKIAGVSHALYKIQLPLDLSDYDNMIDSDGFMTESKNISPLVTISNREAKFLPYVSSATVGSKIYYFGGCLDFTDDTRLYCPVHVFDTQHPDQGLRTVAPLNFPKRQPCVFVDHGMIYVLGAYAGKPEKKRLPGCKCTGHFERYVPCLDQWQVLRDPPIPVSEWADADFKDSAVVMGEMVFIGSPHILAIYNLKDQFWEPRLPPGRDPTRTYHCGSFFVQDTDSLYRFHPPSFQEDHVKISKVGPLSSPSYTTEKANYYAELLLCPLENFDKQQVVAKGTDLEDAFFTHNDYMPHRKLLHMGGRFFCYILSAHFADYAERTLVEPNSRGVWIKILEVPSPNETGDSNIKLRTLATFCYRIDTDWENWALHMSCSVLGSVPDSWIKAPLEKKLSIKLKDKNEGMASQTQSFVTPTKQEGDHAVENTEDKVPKGEQESSRLLAELEKKDELVKECEMLFEKISWHLAELEKKDELLKKYEILFEKISSMVDVKSLMEEMEKK